MSYVRNEGIMSELLPCPFCGMSERGLGYHAAGNKIVCGGCGVTGPTSADGTTKERAVNAWNGHTVLSSKGFLDDSTIKKSLIVAEATDAEIIEISTLYGGSKFSSTDEHCISFEVSQFLAFARAIAGSRK